MKQALIHVAAAILVARSAAAHIVFQNPEARAGYQEVLTLVVPEGCGLSPTVQVRVKVPDGISVVAPEPKEGWQLEIVNRKLEKPVRLEGTIMLSEIPDEIIWTGRLPARQMALFNLFVRIPNRPGDRLFFRTVQTCEQGEERWIETVDPDQEIWRIWLNDRPSPYIVITKPATPQLGVDFQTLARAKEEKDKERRKP